VALDRMWQDQRQEQTLRSILNLGTQLIGLLLVLHVIFGSPQMPAILGLITAGLKADRHIKHRVAFSRIFDRIEGGCPICISSRHHNRRKAATFYRN
jgi:hypothetical protein